MSRYRVPNNNVFQTCSTCVGITRLWSNEDQPRRISMGQAQRCIGATARRSTRLCVRDSVSAYPAYREITKMSVITHIDKICFPSLSGNHQNERDQHRSSPHLGRKTSGDRSDFKTASVPSAGSSFAEPVACTHRLRSQYRGSYLRAVWCVWRRSISHTARSSYMTYIRLSCRGVAATCARK